MKEKLFLSLFLFLSLACSLSSPKSPTIPSEGSGKKQEEIPTAVQSDQPFSTPSNNSLPDNPLIAPTEQIEPEKPNAAAPIELWKAEFFDDFSVSNDRYFAFTPQGNLEAIDLKTGKQLWSKKINTTYKLASVIGSDETYVYFLQSEARVDAYNANDGAAAWHGLIDDVYMVLDIANIDNIDYVFVRGMVENGFNTLVKLDKKTGKGIAQYPLEFSGSIHGPQQPYYQQLGGGYFISGTKSGYFVKYERFFDPNSGSLQKLDPSYICAGMIIGNTPEGIIISQSANAEGKKIPGYSYLACGEGKDPYRSLRTSDFSFTSRLYFIDPNSKMVYAKSNSDPEDKLVGMDITTGEVLWNGLVADPFYFRETQWLGELAGKVLYSSRKFGMTQAYNPKDHTLIWENGEIILSRVLGSIGNQIFAIEGDPKSTLDKEFYLVALDSETGEVSWKNPIDSKSYDYAVGKSWLIMNLHTGSDMNFINPGTGKIEATINLEASGTGVIHQYREINDYAVVVSLNLPNVMNSNTQTGIFHLIDPD